MNSFAHKDGFTSTAIPSLDLIRASDIKEPLHNIYEPSLCIIAQGEKLVLLGEETYKYDSNSYLVASVQLPITGRILHASKECPFLCARLSFSSDQILDIIKEVNKDLSEKSDSVRGMLVSKTSTQLLDAVIRLVNLLNTPNDIPVLAPLFIHEILYRILQDNQGYLIKQFVNKGSNAQSIAKVIKYINDDISKQLRIDDLAEIVNMSPSSLHHHFKKVTAMSPLQYQKQIRLQEARRPLLSEIAEAAEVAFKVGYESPSQFSREYARMFGLPPISDVKNLRQSLTVDFYY
ncbi:AraC family transcriptional regulator N-terminal domain-containing protein [Clostridium chromiireducens]|uniref:AraC family transcriptional regulator N-terminal domain-containing protein n=1 Tax=Clostridium chromiireducens TaxID=225345 RepID=UPI003AF6CB4E